VNLVGVLNVTPDSFSDGGRFVDLGRALDHGRALARAGATIVDVGAESTRPGAEPVEPVEQVRRAIPVIERLAEGPGAPLISIDTTSSVVARAALGAGATIVNDVSAGLDDPAILEVAASAGAGLVLMHRLRRPAVDAYSDRYSGRDRPRYADVVAEVAAWLTGRIEAAAAAGVIREAIAVDPGLGFGKTVEQNLALIRGVGRLVGLGRPVFAGASRKSFIGAVTGESEPARRDPGSWAAAVALARGGARLIRVHDVAGHRQALAMAAACGVTDGPLDASKG